MRSARRSSRTVWVAALLVGLTLLAYLPLFANRFVDFDDEIYITGNPGVLGGLTGRGIRWAFTAVHTANWHPLTWLSHQLDVSLFGLDARGHHLVNLLLHAANALLLFLVLRGLTGALWPGALVAALFAVHPLHVESVAWAAERKDVLSTFWALLTLMAWLAWLRTPAPRRYLRAVAAFALALLAKPMPVTLPFILLLLDVWPLGRWRPAGGGLPGEAGGLAKRVRRLILEKAPLFALAAASSLVTYLVQRSWGAIRPTDFYPFPVRLSNALISWLAYLGKMAWPADLAVIYSHSRSVWPLWQSGGAALVIAAVSAAAVATVRRRPYLLVGWFWYLGTLVPVIGLVQVGSQALADRYTYLPLVGIFIATAWGLADLAGQRAGRRALAGLAACSVLAALAATTWVQVGVWRDNLTLFRHAVAVTKDNWLAELNLALTYGRLGKQEEALIHYEETFRIRPQHRQSHSQLGIDPPEAGWETPVPPALPAGVSSEAGELNRQGLELDGAGKLEAAAARLAAALDKSPGYTEARYNLANVLVRRGLLDEAIDRYEELLQADPNQAMVHNNLAVVQERKGLAGPAESHFRAAARLDPANAEARNNLGVMLARRGRPREAIDFFREALRIRPSYANAMLSLADALLATGEPNEAAAWYDAALRRDPGLQGARDGLERARARQGGGSSSP